MIEAIFQHILKRIMLGIKPYYKKTPCRDSESVQRHKHK